MAIYLDVERVLSEHSLWRAANGVVSRLRRRSRSFCPTFSPSFPPGSLGAAGDSPRSIFFRRQTEATVLQKPFLLTLWKAGRTQGYSWRVREIDLPEDCLPRNPRNLRRTSRTVSFDAALTSYTRCLLTPFLVRVLWSSPELPDLLTPAFDPRSCADRHWASAFGCESCVRMVASCGASRISSALRYPRWSSCFFSNVRCRPPRCVGRARLGSGRKRPARPRRAAAGVVAAVAGAERIGRWAVRGGRRS